MIDITHKLSTLREATAQAIVRVSKPETIEALRNRTVPKGDVFEMAKAAGLLGVKKTPDLLPDCHPMPIEQASIEYEIKGLDVTILMHVKTIYKTGVEVEAMHGVSVVALTIYDMLKPIDKGVEIHHIKLLKKKGACGSREDLAKPCTCHKMKETSCLPEKGTRAVGKTSPNPIHVIKCKESPLCRKKRACGSRGDLIKPNTCHRIPGPQ